MTCMATPQLKNSSPLGHKIYDFGRSFLCYHYFILNLPDPCSSVDKTRKKNIVFSQYNHTRTPAQRVMKFTNLVDSSLFIITLYLVCLIYIWVQRRFYMTYIAMPQHKNLCPGGHEIYNFGRLFLGHHYYFFKKYINFITFERNT